MPVERGGQDMSGSILHISKRLLAELNANSINYCHWKNNHFIEKSLAGEDDLDFIINESDYDRFQFIITALGFKDANRHIQFPGIFHFYGLDTATADCCTLHIHTELVTGESHTKNYHLTLERNDSPECRYHLPVQGPRT
jgi:hypothetical protein